MNTNSGKPLHAYHYIEFNPNRLNKCESLCEWNEGNKHTIQTRHGENEMEKGI